MAGDDINLEAGDEAENVIAGKRNRQERIDPRQTVNFQGDTGGSDITRIWIELGRHGQDINTLIRQMDDLPARVRDLEKTEVVIRTRANADPEIVIRPAPQFSTRTLLIVLVTALAIIIALVAFLVYWQITHAA